MFTQNKRYKVSWVDYVNVDKNRSKLNKNKNAQNPGKRGELTFGCGLPSLLCPWRQTGLHSTTLSAEAGVFPPLPGGEDK